MFKNYLNVFLISISVILFIKVLSVTDFFSPARYQPDFDAYYQLVSDIRSGTNPYSVTHMQTLGPPLVFLYFYPFSLFSLHDAQTLNMAINLVSGYLCCAVLAAAFFKRNQLTLTLILSIIYYASFLSRYSLQIGQPTLLISLLVACVITTIKFQSIFLSALLTLKTFFVFPIFALIRTPKSFLRTGLFFLATLILSLAVIRPQWYADYSFRRFPEINIFHTENYVDSLHYENQSLPSFFSRLQISQYLPVVYPTVIAISTIVVTLSGNLELGILFSFLASPVLWQHYLIALFPLFVKTFVHATNTSRLLLTAFALFLWFPDLRLWTEPINLKFGLLASHFFLSLCLLILAQIPQLRYNSKR